MSDLGGSQISSLMETLPGIANVLRSPVANAIVNLVRAAARLADFNLADAEELIQYATRRSLLGNEEGEQLIAEAKAAAEKRLARAADREKTQKARAKTKARVKAVKVPTKPPAKPKPPARAARPVKAVKSAKVVKKTAKPSRKR